MWQRGKESRLDQVEGLVLVEGGEGAVGACAALVGVGGWPVLERSREWLGRLVVIVFAQVHLADQTADIGGGPPRGAMAARPSRRGERGTGRELANGVD